MSAVMQSGDCKQRAKVHVLLKKDLKAAAREVPFTARFIGQAPG